MSEDSVESILARFGEGQWTTPRRGGSDRATALVVSCSMSQAACEESLWPIDPSRSVTGLTTPGNQTRVRHGGELVLDGSLSHLAAERNVRTVLVVGHTDCDVISDAYEQFVAPAGNVPTGIEARLAPLVSLVRDAVDAGIVDTSTTLRTARHRLVEYNVVRQVQFLTERLSNSTTVAGYVHDRTGVYGSFPGKHYLATVDGETNDTELRARLPDADSISVAGLLP